MEPDPPSGTRPQTAEPPRFWLDDARWPLLVLTLPPRPKDEEVVAYLKHLGTYRQRREPYALLVDSTHALSFSARQRRMQSDHVREGLPITRIYLKGIAYVAESAFKRGIITAIHWLVELPAPHQVFATKAQAEAWLLARLKVA